MSEEEDERLDELASTVLLAAIEKQWFTAYGAINDLVREFGGPGLVDALYVWCDTLIAHTGGHGTDKLPTNGLRLQSARDGRFSDINEADPALAWAARLITARRLLDDDQTVALMTVLGSGDHKQASSLIRAVLSVTSSTLADHLQTCPVGIDGTHDDQKNELPKPPPGHTWN